MDLGRVPGPRSLVLGFPRSSGGRSLLRVFIGCVGAFQGAGFGVSCSLFKINKKANSEL